MSGIPKGGLPHFREAVSAHRPETKRDNHPLPEKDTLLSGSQNEIFRHKTDNSLHLISSYFLAALPVRRSLRTVDEVGIPPVSNGSIL